MNSKKKPDPYRILPPASKEERAKLRSSIEANGLQDSVVADEHGNIIDGHERRDICKELGIDWLVGADVRINLNDAEKKALSIDRNLCRRNIVLNSQKRKELIEVYLTANSHLSDNQIADIFAASQATVNRYRNQLIQMNKLSKPLKTIGKDGKERSVGDRKKPAARFIVKGKKEYDTILPDIQEVAEDLSGIVRQPSKIKTQAMRKRALALVDTDAVQLPSSIEIKHCDFRKLKIQKETVDVVVTDPPWSIDNLEAWKDLGRLAAEWLKPNGVLVSYIGNNFLPHFCSAVMEHLMYHRTIALTLDTPTKSLVSKYVEMWRPIVVFVKNPRTRVEITDWMKSTGSEKKYHDWQQALPEAQYLIEKLSKPKAVICDPFLGTGTTAVAVDLVGGGRKFIGCDILDERVRIARHRVATEGRRAAG